MDYLQSQKIIHWLMATAIMIDLNVAQKFGGEMQLWDRLESRADHATMGLIITFLLILRIILRYKYGAPSLPNSMTKWQILAAQVGSLWFIHFNGCFGANRNNFSHLCLRSNIGI
jgi:cytochrome b561